MGQIKRFGTRAVKVGYFTSTNGDLGELSSERGFVSIGIRITSIISTIHIKRPAMLKSEQKREKCASSSR